MKIREILYYYDGVIMALKTKLALLGSQKLELIKLRKQFEDAISAYEETKRTIIENYAKRDDNGNIIEQNNTIFWDDDHKYIANKELNELENADFKITINKSAVRIPDVNDYEPIIIEVLLLISTDDNIFQT